MRALESLLPIFAAAALQAASWAPIPPEVWAMKEDPAQGVKGAVVLERHMTFTGTAITHLFRVRVLSEEGRSAADMDAFLPESTAIEGRTVHRDGSIVLFDKAKDFSEKSIPRGDDGGSRKVVIPPGVTADCVVEVRWVDTATSGEAGHQIPSSLGYSFLDPLGSPYKVQEEIVEFLPLFNNSALVIPGRGAKPELASNGRARKYVFHNLPGREEPPFALYSLAGRPEVMAWWQPDDLVGIARGDIKNYWNYATTLYWKPYFQEAMRKGSAFKAMAAELSQGLPAEPGPAAVKLLQRLDRRIRNVHYPTLAEKASLDLKQVLAEDDSFEQAHNLEVIVRRGTATREEMGFLFLALLESNGIKPQLALLHDRETSLFHFDIPNIFQTENVLVGVPRPEGGLMWLDPARRYAAPGLILPSLQGVEALTIDTATWKPDRAIIPVQPPGFNTAQYKYKLAFGEGAETFTVKGEFTGYPEYRERRRFMAQAPEEQARTLREAMERNIPDSTIRTATVREAANPDANVAWDVEGTLDQPATQSFQLDPFPGLPSPLPLPAAWPDQRTEPIVMPHLGVQLATCEFQLPAGFALKPGEAMAKENSFGRVNLRIATTGEGDATRVKVALRVDVLRPSAPAEAYAELRTFLGWVETARRTGLVLVRK